MKENFLIRQYRKSFEYISECRKFIYFITGIFFVFALIGFFVPVPVSIGEKIIEIIRKIFMETEGMGNFELIRFIVLNNLQSSFFGMLLGILLWIPTLLFSMLNGYLLGFVASMSVDIEGFVSLWRIFPHGIFELPAVFIALGMGLKIGSFIFQKKKMKSLMDYTEKSFVTFVIVVIPLLIIAAIIEGSLIYALR